jgi:PST family polysaccharide transporter
MRKLSFIFNNFSDPIKKVLGNTTWLISDKIIRMAIGLFVAAWVARYLGPDQYGLLNFSLALVVLVGVLANLGLQELIIRNIVKEPEKRDELLGTAFIIKAVGGVLVFFISILIAFLIRPDDSLTHMLIIIIAAGPIFQSFDVIEYYFKSQVEAKYSVIAKSISFFVINVLKVVLIIVEAPLIAFAFAVTADILLGSASLVAAYRLSGKYIRKWKINLALAKEYLAEGYLLAISAIAVVIYMRIDQIMIGQLIGDKEVGVYSAAVKLSEVLYVIPLALMESTAPVLVKAYKENIKKYNSSLQKLFNLFTVIGLAIAMPTIFLSDWIVEIVFGGAYSNSSGIFAIHIWSIIFVGWVLLRHYVLIFEKIVYITMIATLFGAAANVIANYFLIPIYKGEGAAIATLISQIISSTFILIFFKKSKKLVVMEFKSLFRFYDIKPE